MVKKVITMPCANGCVGVLAPCIVSPCIDHVCGIPTQLDITITFAPVGFSTNGGGPACVGMSYGSYEIDVPPPSDPNVFNQYLLTPWPKECDYVNALLTQTFRLHKVKPPDPNDPVYGFPGVTDLWVNQAHDYHGGDYIVKNADKTGYSPQNWGTVFDQQGFASMPNPLAGCVYNVNFTGPPCDAACIEQWLSYGPNFLLISPQDSNGNIFSIGNTVGVAIALYLTFDGTNCGLGLQIWVLDLESWVTQFYDPNVGPPPNTISTIPAPPDSLYDPRAVLPFNLVTGAGGAGGYVGGYSWIGINNHFQLAAGTLPGVSQSYGYGDPCFEAIGYDPCNPLPVQWPQEPYNRAGWAPLGGALSWSAQLIDANPVIDTEGGSIIVACGEYSTALLLHITGDCTDWNGDYELAWDCHVSLSYGLISKIQWGWAGVMKNGLTGTWQYVISYSSQSLYTPWTGPSYAPPLDVTGLTSGSFRVAGTYYDPYTGNPNTAFDHTVNWALESLGSSLPPSGLPLTREVSHDQASVYLQRPNGHPLRRYSLRPGRTRK